MTKKERILANLECIQRYIDGIKRELLEEEVIDLTEQKEGLQQHGF